MDARMVNQCSVLPRYSVCHNVQVSNNTLICVCNVWFAIVLHLLFESIEHADFVIGAEPQLP